MYIFLRYFLYFHKLGNIRQDSNPVLYGVKDYLCLLLYGISLNLTPPPQLVKFCPSAGLQFQFLSPGLLQLLPK